MSAVGAQSVERRLAAMSKMSLRWLFPLCISLSHVFAVFCGMTQTLLKR